MRSSWLAVLLVVVLLPSALFALPWAAPNARAAGSGAAVSGNITGKSVLAYHGSAIYTIRGTGGPATLPNGTINGNLSFYLSVAGPNLTGVSMAPQSGKVLTGIPGTSTLTVGNLSEVLTITCLLASVLNGTNESTNFTFTVNVVQPYVLSTTLYNLGASTVGSFPIVVDLDGVPVGNVTVPTLLGHTSYHFTFSYATVSLASGTHVFSIYLTTVHGLVRFANGTTVYTVAFTIPGPPPSYTVWYVVGAVAFFGALFIFGARVGARRRGTSKK